ncbi:NAD(P)/FAD-dependent oxidoreductase [Riemerella columbina]|uniref:NAD(P)/FAD-dependent oxidoreductase n=1 Tax=Riemerella columbina TaxID=103810 RepID=UPI0003827987|nr:NAD(P)/FAD-dependent oxidoreductase [Riemerella columbina]
MNHETPHIVIIGGGAAGFFCAVNLDTTQYRVSILEQNSEVLQKVKISGGGRCNVTHACFDARDLVQFYPRGNRELRSVFSKFQPADTMGWFEERGVSLKIESDNRVFPESNSSQTIIDTLVGEVEHKGINILKKAPVKAIEPQPEGYNIITNQGEVVADIIVFATGSSPKAHKLLEGLGHQIVPAVPSLFTFNIKDDLLDGLAGTSFPYAEVKLPQLKAEESGALLITHWGLSGPAILKLSAWEARRLAEYHYEVDLEVNFLGLPIDTCLHLLKETKQDYAQKKLVQYKPFEITNRFWQKVLHQLKIDEDKHWANLSKQEMQQITEMLCRKPFKVKGKSTFKEEFVTAGGVELKEIDFKTMASKKLPHFYIAGEVLNIDAVTGGFNFQACWSEAWLIAQHLNQKNH